MSEETSDNALRPSLMKVRKNNIFPVRGPKEYINNRYKYTFEVNGSLEYFERVETIYKEDKKIYVLKCHI